MPLPHLSPRLEPSHVPMRRFEAESLLDPGTEWGADATTPMLTSGGASGERH